MPFTMITQTPGTSSKEPKIRNAMAFAECGRRDGGVSGSDMGLSLRVEPARGLKSRKVALVNG